MYDLGLDFSFGLFLKNYPTTIFPSNLRLSPTYLLENIKQRMTQRIYVYIFIYLEATKKYIEFGKSPRLHYQRDNFGILSMSKTSALPLFDSYRSGPHAPFFPSSTTNVEPLKLATFFLTRAHDVTTTFFFFFFILIILF